MFVCLVHFTSSRTICSRRNPRCYVDHYVESHVLLLYSPQLCFQVTETASKYMKKKKVVVIRETAQKSFTKNWLREKLFLISDNIIFWYSLGGAKFCTAYFERAFYKKYRSSILIKSYRTKPEMYTRKTALLRSISKQSDFIRERNKFYFWRIRICNNATMRRRGRNENNYRNKLATRWFMRTRTRTSLPETTSMHTVKSFSEIIICSASIFCALKNH